MHGGRALGNHQPRRFGVVTHGIRPRGLVCKGVMMSTEMILREAIGLAREGRKTEARWLLEELLRTERANETAWLWYADCVETVDERVQALERCLRHNPNARRARAGLDLLRNPRAARPAAETPPKAVETADKPPAGGKPAEAAVFISEPEPAVQAALDAAGVAPAFELTPEDEWLLSDGAAVFTVSPEALSPEEMEDMAARTEAFLSETRVPIRHRRPRGQEDWPNLEQTTGSRPTKRRRAAQTAEAGMSRAYYTTLTALAVVILMVLALGAAIVLRGV